VVDGFGLGIEERYGSFGVGSGWDDDSNHHTVRQIWFIIVRHGTKGST
jgi:hypothetical protein